MNIAITGGAGTFARALREWLPERAFGDEHATYLTRAECDVRDAESVAAALYIAQPDVVIHAAAITDHQCPDARALIETNVLGTANVVEWCADEGVKLVYLSTHYVYPGETGGYREYDAPAPIGAYAMSKLAGERIVRSIDNGAFDLIVRGSWYDYDTRLKKWIASGALMNAWMSREPVRDAARKVAALIRAEACGTYNIGGPRRTPIDILRDEGYEGAAIPITRELLDDSFVAPYPFPADTSVSTEKFDALGLVL